MKNRTARRLLVGALLGALALTWSPLVGSAAAADGDPITAFGPNGRATAPTGATPLLTDLDVSYRLGFATAWVQHDDPSIMTAFEPGLPGTVSPFDIPGTLFSSRGTGQLVFQGSDGIGLNFGPGAVSGFQSPPDGYALRRPTGTAPGAFFAERHSLTPGTPPVLVFYDPQPHDIGPIGRPEVLTDGRFAVAAAAGQDLSVRFYDATGLPDATRAVNGVATHHAAAALQVDDVVAQADGGVVVVTRHGALPAGAQTVTTYRFDDAGSLVDTDDSATFTWSPTLVELPGRVLAYVGTTSSPSVANVVLRVDTTGASPFSSQTLTGGVAVIDDAVADSTGRMIVVGGTTARPRTTMTIARFANDGSLDTTFGNAGTVARALPESTSRSFVVTASLDSGITAAASQDASLLVDRMMGSAPRAYRERFPLAALAVATDEGAFTAITPIRAIDTRTGEFPVRAGEPLTVSLVGLVPDGTSAVALNLTVTGSTQAGFARVWASDQPMPEVSMLNFEAGETVANATISALGASRSLSLYSHVTADLVVDVVGYWTPQRTARAGRFVPITPVRLVDTRTGDAPRLPDGTVTTIDVRSRADLALEHASAVMVTVTVVDPVGPSYVTVWPGGARPLASSLNVGRAGELRTNLATVGVGSDGTVSIFNQRGAHLVVDVVGSFTDASGPSARAGLMRPVAPARVYDSRLGRAGPLAPSTPALAAVLCCGDTGAGAMYNLTAVDTADAGFLTAYPSSAGNAVPLASSVNFDGAGQRRASLAATVVDATGSVALYANVSTDYVIDVLAVFI